LIATLQSGIAEAKIRLVQEGGRSPSEPVAEEQLPADQSPQILTGLVQISDDLLGSLSSQDVVFIFAKASDGPPMPIAAMRVPVNQLPFSFVLDDSLSLMPSRKLSDFPQFLVGARISRSGNAIRASGDLESTTTLVKSGENIEITIDSTVP
jgi:cytochrome c-type biogenesis protein CcmH